MLQVNKIRIWEPILQLSQNIALSKCYISYWNSFRPNVCGICWRLKDKGNTEDRGSVTRNQDSVAQVQNCHPAKSTLLIFHSTVKPVLSRHLKTGEKKVLKTDGSLMHVESIAECSVGAFCNTFDQH